MLNDAPRIDAERSAAQVSVQKKDTNLRHQALPISAARHDQRGWMSENYLAFSGGRSVFS